MRELLEGVCDLFLQSTAQSTAVLSKAATILRGIALERAFDYCILMCGLAP